MKNIFIGLILVLFDFNLNLGAATIGLIPDFIGFYFILQGVRELKDQSAKIASAEKPAFVMAIFTAVLYLFDLLTISARLYPLGYILGLISTIAALYVLYLIVSGIGQIEAEQAKPLEAAKLFTAWKIYAVVSVSLYFLTLIRLLGLLWFIAGLGATVYFIYMFNKSKNLYYA